MVSFSGLGIGLSFVFGCFFLGLIAELYYLVWFKKNRETAGHHYSNYLKSLSRLLSFQTKHRLKTDQQNHKCNETTTDLESGLQKKGFGEEGLDAELISAYNLCGPPRFLFTIKEETKEDLESLDGRSKRSKLGDLLFTFETPIFTPLASPRVYNQHGFSFNPMLGGFTEADVNRALSSPLPKFKFLRDAEEKLKMKLLAKEAENKAVQNLESSHQSKVLPLAPSPLSNESRCLKKDSYKSHWIF